MTAGNLKTTEQQMVTQQPDKIIVIESTNPEVVYVPTYSPTVVYGGWYYPTYYYPPDVRRAAARLRPDDVRRGHGVGSGYLGGGCNWGWGHSDINVNDQPQQQLQPQHEHQLDDINAERRSLAAQRRAPQRRELPNGATAKQYGGQGASNRVSRDQARGFNRGASASTRPAGGAGSQRPGAAASAGTRDLGGQRPSAGSTRPSASTRDVGGQNAAAGRSSSSAGRAGNSAYSGSRSPSFDRAASGRGASSRGMRRRWLRRRTRRHAAAAGVAAVAAVGASAAKRERRAC